MSIELHTLPAGPIETNAYLLLAPTRGEAVLIDAPGEVWCQVEPLLARARCTLTELWITHGHWDHMQGAAEIITAVPQVVVRAHPDDRILLEKPEVMSVFLRGVDLLPVRVDHWLAHGEKLAALGLDWEVRHVPGHCPGNVLFYAAALGEVGTAIVGDALFAGSIGRTDLPGGSFAQLERSICEQIYPLPPETVVLPGHGESTTVGRERATNPHVRP
jgi:hydroxyacylglutathione hydrolase